MVVHIAVNLHVHVLQAFQSRDKGSVHFGEYDNENNMNAIIKRGMWYEIIVNEIHYRWYYVSEFMNIIRNDTV